MLSLTKKTLLLLLYLTTLLASTAYSQVNGHYYFLEDDSTLVIQNNDTLINPWTGGFNAVQISTIDLNGDAYDDLFVFDRTGHTIIPFVWDNSVSYWKYAPSYVNEFPELGNWAILRDYNCDGKKDIFSYVSGGVGVWKMFLRVAIWSSSTFQTPI